ncbi:MAG: hypothetical protein IT461_06705 [Planctomycetes bacterium]|nr:hypothetical protein [Planctomycetota bacterium]
MLQVFSLGFDLRRVLLMSVAGSWTVAVVGLYLALISWRVAGYPLDAALAPKHLEHSWRLLVSPDVTFDRALLWIGVAGLWWLGFARIITPVFRSLALEVSRDERPDQKAMVVASHRLSGLVTGSPLSALLVAALFFGCVLLCAVLAKLPAPVGTGLAALILPLALIAALIAAAVLIVTVVSLPMMTPAAVIECRDLMDVVSRAAAYVLQRPFRYLAGLCAKLGVTLVAAVVGGAVFLLAWALIYLALVMVGEGDLALSSYRLVRRSGEVRADLVTGAAFFAAAFYGSAMIWLGWFLTVGAASDVILYMVMRYEVDGVTFDEIMIPQEHIEKHGLTALDTQKQQQAAQAASNADPEPAKASN